MTAEQAAALEAMQAKPAAELREKAARPFRFEDLPVDENGQRLEPESWGPVYPALPGVDKWRKLNSKRELSEDETRAYGAAVHEAIRSLNAVKPRQGLNPASMCVSGQHGDFSAAKHRAKLTAALHATAAVDRRSWATSQAIGEAYELAMALKRERLETLERARLAATPIRKPKFTLRNGELVLLAAA